MDTIAADAERTCACCHRKHRLLVLVGGLWMGRNCAESYMLYRDWPNNRAFNFHGYEAKLAQIEKMIGATK